MKELQIHFDERQIKFCIFSVVISLLKTRHNVMHHCCYILSSIVLTFPFCFFFSAITTLESSSYLHQTYFVLKFGLNLDSSWQFRFVNQLNSDTLAGALHSLLRKWFCKKIYRDSIDNAAYYLHCGMNDLSKTVLKRTMRRRKASCENSLSKSDAY